MKRLKKTATPTAGKSVYETLSGKKNPQWADKIYNTPGGGPLTDLISKAKRAGTWVSEKAMNKLK